MAKTNNSSTPAQGGGSDSFDHIVTQADLDANKDLIDAGVKIGDTIQLPKVQDDAQGVLLEAKQPEWVKELLLSNEATQKSNEKLVEALSKISEVLQQNSSLANPSAEKPQLEVNKDAKYEVAPGKSFRDPLDFTKEYAEGDEVNHLSDESLKVLLNSSLIVESE